MEISQRSYRLEATLRPKPLVHKLSHPEGLIILTPWGRRTSEEISSFFRCIEDQVQALHPPSHSPEEHYPTLGDVGSRLHNSLHVANEFVLKKMNVNVHEFVFECLVLLHIRGIIYWSAVGLPHLLLKSVSKNRVYPLHYSPDWEDVEGGLPPLFSQGLGLDKSVLVHSGICEVQNSDLIYLISSSRIPTSIFTDPISDLEDLQKKFMGEEKEVPHWLGFVNLP